MFSFGTDPEFMLQKRGKFVSAVGLIPGTKEYRHSIGDHKIYCDNVLAECELKPGSNKDEVLDNIKDCLKRSADLLSPAKMILKSAHLYPRRELNSMQAWECACDSEWCAYDVALVKQDKVKNIIKKTNLRVAGGHIHLGDEFIADNKAKTAMGIINRLHKGILPVVRMLDLFLAVPSIFLNKDQTAATRLNLYGAGRYRKPIHGVEYRTMGNFWLESPRMTALIYDICHFVINFVKDDKHSDLWKYDADKVFLLPHSAHSCLKYDPKKLKATIGKHDKKGAVPFMEIIKFYLPAKIYKEIQILSERNHKDLYTSWSLAA